MTRKLQNHWQFILYSFAVGDMLLSSPNNNFYVWIKFPEKQKCYHNQHNAFASSSIKLKNSFLFRTIQSHEIHYPILTDIRSSYRLHSFVRWPTIRSRAADARKDPRTHRAGLPESHNTRRDCTVIIHHTLNYHHLNLNAPPIVVM